MKINEITISQKIQAAQYEPVELAMTATINEDDDVNESIDNLRFYIDYKLRKDSRDAQFEKFTKQLESDDVGEKRREDMQAWLDKYHEAEERAVSIEFNK